MVAEEAAQQECAQAVVNADAGAGVDQIVRDRAGVLAAKAVDDNVDADTAASSRSQLFDEAPADRVPLENVPLEVYEASRIVDGAQHGRKSLRPSIEYPDLVHA